MHHLEVPLADAGLQVDGHEALREQVVAGTVAAVLVDGRRFNGQVDEAGFGVDRNLGPDADVAGPFPRTVLPRVVAELARAGNRVEAPQLLAGLHVERADQALGVRAVPVADPFEHRRADDDRVVHDRRRRVQTDFALLEIELLVLADDDADLQVDDTAGAERHDRHAGLRVQFDEPVAGRHVEDALVTAPVGPVGEAAARELAGRPARGALALVHAVHPLHLTGGGVESHHRAPGPGGRIDRPLDHDRRAFELVLRTRAQVVGLESPGHFELAEVGGVDLIERRVLAAAQVGGVHRPLAVLRARLPRVLPLESWHEQRHAEGEEGNCWCKPDRGVSHGDSIFERAFEQRPKDRGIIAA